MEGGVEKDTHGAPPKHPFLGGNIGFSVPER